MKSRRNIRIDFHMLRASIVSEHEVRIPPAVPDLGKERAKGASGPQATDFEHKNRPKFLN